MKVQPAAAGHKVAADLLRVLPPASVRISLNDKRALWRGMRQELSKYVTSTRPTLSGFLESNFSVAPYNQPVLGDVLIQASSVHEGESKGSFLFLVRGVHVEDNLDLGLTLTALFKLCGCLPEENPEMYKMASLWYGDKNCLDSYADVLATYVATGTLHKHLVPMGPIVKSTHSTFVSRVTTIVRGEGGSVSGEDNSVVVFPKSVFVSLDDADGTVQRPVGTHVTYYLCITYPLRGQTPTVAFHIVASSKSYEELTDALKHMYAETALHKYDLTQNSCYISALPFLVACRLGRAPNTCSYRLGTVNYRGTASATVEVKAFEVDTGPWNIIL